MKTNPRDSAFPVVANQHDESIIEEGLTKREYFAALAMQGYAANRNQYSISEIAQWSVAAADALLNSLNID